MQNSRMVMKMAMLIRKRHVLDDHSKAVPRHDVTVSQGVQCIAC